MNTSQNPANSHASLFKILDRLHRQCQIQGVPFLGWTEASLRKFESLAPEHRERLIAGILGYLSILESAPVRAGNPIAQEKAFIESAFAQLGVRPKDPNWDSTLGEGQLIEIYNVEMIQLYRNLEFLRQCSYDFLTLLCHEWYELYERPQAVTKALLARAHEILDTSDQLTPYQLPLHLLREKHLDAKRIFKVEMVSLIPLFDEEGEKVAFLHNINSSLTVEGEDASKIRIF